ncbi:6-pyruvoyl trahydropterin synthase family protein [Komagataeibacter oboediens]|uniref:6-pyruvoyl trahydropterin synthase family protein n=1 Tax=Komagataeibacter oboediens TaxID=65958 RepID=UPI001C2DDD2E|nr:6-carboxytetrahydropterin synthase [Komagataeibacter oboediens]MBV1823296.1 6-carboxytetrahydropterin synthase [Komagataeibacter oboediens]
MFELVFTRRFSMAHRLLAGESERCALPHGHNEYIRAHLRATAPTALDGHANMVMPFQRAKGVWHGFIDDHVDHALQLAEDDPLLAWFTHNEPQRAQRILVTPGDPTTELLACLLMAKLNAFLAADGGALTCASIEIEETPTNTVRYSGDPLAVLPCPRPAPQCWWRRPDMTLSDT